MAGKIDSKGQKQVVWREASALSSAKAMCSCALTLENSATGKQAACLGLLVVSG